VRLRDKFALSGEGFRRQRLGMGTQVARGAVREDQWKISERRDVADLGIPLAAGENRAQAHTGEGFRRELCAGGEGNGCEGDHAGTPR